MKAIPVSDLIIRSAGLEDVPLLLEFVNGIAEYEHLCHIVPDSVSVGFVAFFHNFSTIGNLHVGSTKGLVLRHLKTG